MRGRILIIDDDWASRELMSYLLHSHGHEVLVACAGEEGLAVAAEQHPDLILCDLCMKGMDGCEVCRRLRADARLRGIPLLAVTIRTTLGDCQEIQAAGFSGFIGKPFASETFVDRVESLLYERAG